MKFLVVEDDLAIRDILVKILVNDGGVVDAEANGDLGLQRALTSDYDLIILDINLPGHSGWEIAREIVKKGDTPFIFLTAKGTSTDMVKGLDLGADDYLTKPFSIDVLKARVRSVMRRRSLISDPNVRLKNDVEFEVATKTVRRKGELVDLTVRELALLELFIHHPRKILSKSWLVERMIHDEVEVENPGNLVEVNLYRLRKKLGANIVETKRGLGYELGSVDA